MARHLSTTDHRKELAGFWGTVVPLKSAGHRLFTISGVLTMDHRSAKSLLALFAAAAFSSTRQMFGGVPLQRLSPKARRKYRREFTGNHGTTDFKGHLGARSMARARAFKAKHGHFATEC